jgi:hypothetical protein
MQLLPVVDGLEREYGARVTFRRHSERTPEGAALMRRYGLPAHGFVATDAQGKVVWKLVGHGTNRQQLEAAVKLAMGA